MANDQRFDSRYTGEEMETAFSVALAIANHSGIPKGTGNGSIQIISMDTDILTSDGERIPTSAVVAQAIAAARKVSELLVFKGIVQTTDDLPADAKPGFVYIVAQKDNENYAWDGVSWTPIGKLIAPIILSSQSASYQIGDSGDAIPTGVWIDAIPSVPQGKYLWTRMEVQLSVGDPVVWYSVAYSGVDGKALTAADVGALPASGGDMEGPINMNGQPITGLNPPTEDTHAANKGYVDTAKAEANTYTDASVRKAAPRNLLDNSDFTNLVAQADIGGNHGTIPYAADRWILDSGTVSYEAGVGLTLNGTIRQKLEFPPTGETSAFVGMASGAASISYADGTVTITSSGVLKWAALYSGVYTAATMPEYHPKGYGAELAECQRYYQNLSTIDNAFDVVLNGFVSNTSTALAVSLPGMSKMRITPTVVFSGGIVVRGNNGYSSDATYGTPYMSPNVVPRLNTLVFYKSDNSAWAGIDNNTNISISLKLGSILSLSADL